MLARQLRKSLIPTGLLFLFSASPSQADLVEYSQDFEGLIRTDPNALANDGWLASGNVFDGDGTLEFGYGAGPAPNGGPGFAAIVVGEGGPLQGAQQLSVYNDYSCCDPPTTVTSAGRISSRATCFTSRSSASPTLVHDGRSRSTRNEEHGGRGR